MEWTTEKPSVDGIYLVRKTPDDKPHRVEVQSWPPSLWRAIHHFDADDPGRFEGYEGAEWYGPIAPPSEER